jgi:ribonuclease D
LQEHVISKEEDFLKIVDHLSKEQSIAVDLEFDKNRYRYGFTICLMQVATKDECFVIDPLSDGIDISLIFPVMEDPAIVKLAFEFGEDIRLFHHLGCKPKNLYDLSVATKLLDYSQVSLGSILSQFLDIEADKSSQKSNWFQRPLSEKQIKYAGDDVRYLHSLESILTKRIAEKNMENWVEEERIVFENQDFQSTENSNYYKTRDKDGMSEVQWYIFERLIEFREDLAKESNRPPYQIMDKDFLLGLAKNKSLISSFFMESKASKRLLNEAFKVRLLELVKSSKQSAIEKGLSLTDLVNPKLSKEEMDEVRAQKNEKDSLVSNTYKPIQQLIKKDFGENAALYIMGNKLMNELAAGSFDSLRDYKRDLILGYAKQLNMNLSFS